MTLESITDLEAEYDNRARVPEHPEILERWQKQASDFREECLAENRATLDIPYGPGVRHTYDLFNARRDTIPAPKMALFIHGGYWRALDKSYFSHVANCLTIRGFDVAATNYRLCPHVKISDIIEDVRSVTEHLYKTHGRKIVPYGHSAGGHLVSSLLATNWHARGLPEDLTDAGMIISGIYDLTPLVNVSVNADLHLDRDSARAASTRFWPAVSVRDLAIVAGGEETSAFIGQSTGLHDDWKDKCGKVTLDILEGANHFTIVDPLFDPQSPMSRRLAELASGR